MSPAKVISERGWIVPVGGAEEKIQDRRILAKFVELAGSDLARIAVIPTASELHDTGPRYVQLFRELGAVAAVALPFFERSDCDRVDLLDQLERATGVFFTGGNQLRIATVLGGTDVARIVRRLGSSRIDLRWLNDSYHVATLDNDLPLICSETLAFIRGITGR